MLLTDPTADPQGRVSFSVTGDCLIQWKRGSIECQDGDIACVHLQREPEVKAEGHGDVPWGCSMGIFHGDVLNVLTQLGLLRWAVLVADFSDLPNLSLNISRCNNQA